MGTIAAVPRSSPKLFLGLSAAFWLAVYQLLAPVSDALASLLPVDRESHPGGGALQFFLYDTPKVLLLTAVVFVMGMVNWYFTPERTRALLAGRAEGAGGAGRHANGRETGRNLGPIGATAILERLHISSSGVR